MKKIKNYKGIDIYTDKKDANRPFMTVQTNIPVIECLNIGHKTLEDAIKYINNISRIS